MSDFPNSAIALKETHEDAHDCEIHLEKTQRRMIISLHLIRPEGRTERLFTNHISIFESYFLTIRINQTCLPNLPLPSKTAKKKFLTPNVTGYLKGQHAIGTAYKATTNR